MGIMHIIQLIVITHMSNILFSMILGTGNIYFVTSQSSLLFIYSKYLIFRV